MKVFLGGTCAQSKWRDEIIPQLKCDYFNPVVKDWTPECQENEEREKKICNYHLYVITPKMKGVFSIAEATNDSVALGSGCIFCVTKEEDDRDWTEGERRSLEATEKLIRNNGGKICKSLYDVVEYLNSEYDNTTEMEPKHYTDYLRGEDLLKKLKSKGMPILKRGFWGEKTIYPTYSEVFDWLMRKGIKIALDTTSPSCRWSVVYGSQVITGTEEDWHTAANLIITVSLDLIK